MSVMHRMTSEVRAAWGRSAPLTFTAILMTAAFVASLAGIILDDRIITGVPAWLKPAKFAISSAIYAATIAWLLRYLHVWPRALRFFAWTISLTLILEVAIIDVQAARGTTSHFNTSSLLNGVLFGIMGTAIVVLWLASIGVLIALFRQRFTDVSWGWALRLGMLVTVLGAGAGGLMVRPTADQLTQQRAARRRPPIIGAHTVGAPDGGAGLPGLGWSTTHGDLRIPHFLGLHAVQAIPLLAFAIGRRKRTNSLQPVVIAFAGYLSFAAILTWQALRGQSIVDPDAVTATAFAVWAAALAGAIMLSRTWLNGGAAHRHIPVQGAQGGRS